MKKVLIFLLAVFGFTYSIAQDIDEMDSLKAALNEAKHDTLKCEILNQLIEAEVDDNIWPKYNISMKFIAERNIKKYPKNHPLAKVYMRYLAAAINNIGYLYSLKGDMLHALNYYHECLAIQKQINDKKGLATSLNNIGSIYNDQDDADKAYEYYLQSYTIQKEIGDMSGMAVSLINIGYYFDGKKETKKALEYYEQSFKISKKIDDQPGQVYTMNNMGLSFLALKNAPLAMEYFRKALILGNEIGYLEGVSHSYYCLGVIYSSQRNYTMALENTLKSLEMAKENGFVQRMRDAYQLLYSIYKSLGKFEKALEMHELHISVRDSLTNEQTKKMSLKRQFKSEYDVKVAADSVKAMEEKKVANAQLAESKAKLQQEKTQRLALYGGLLLIGAFAAFVLYRYRISKQQQRIIEHKEHEAQIQKALVEEKQKEIIDSIYYAKQIQMALLPQEAAIEKILKRLKQKSTNSNS